MESKMSAVAEVPLNPLPTPASPNWLQRLSALDRVQRMRLGAGVALLPLKMFEQDLAQGRLVQPFAKTLDLGRYWLTRLRSRAESDAARRFREWLEAQDGAAPVEPGSARLA